jgi:hypothetical protein
MFIQLRRFLPFHSVNKTLLIHFLICSFGFLKLVMLLASDLYYTNFLGFAVSKLGGNALVVGTGKLEVILQYFSGLLALLVFFALASTVATCQNVRSSRFSQSFIYLGIYFLGNIFFTYRLFRSANDFSHWCIPWLILTLALPVILLRAVPLKRTLPTFFVVTLTFGLLMQLFLIFQPLIFKPMLIENDYMDIPGQTQLKSGEWVDNTRYINEHNIGGILKYDPRKDNGETPLPRKDTFVSIEPNSSLQLFLDININNARSRYIYYPKQHYLSVQGPMSPTEYTLLNDIFKNPHDKAQIDTLYLQSLHQKFYYDSRIYTPEEWDFIQKNKIELLDQAKTGWFFYHHNYFFAPILAVALDGVHAAPMMVYGWLNTIVVAKILKLMGGVNYQHYFQFLFSLYPFYYGCFFLAVLIIFRRIEYAAIGLLFAATALLFLGIEPTRLAPGFNPIRHFLDVFVLATFFIYTKNRQWPWLIGSYFLCFLALLCNKEFGLFLTAAVTGAVIIYEGLEKKKLSFSIFAAFVGGLTGLILFMWVPGKNPSVGYMLLGVGTPATSAKLVKSLLAVNAVLYFLAVVFRQLKTHINYFWLGVIFYCQFLLFYLLWYPELHHLLDIAVPLAILFLSLVYLLIRYFNNEIKERAILTKVIVLLFFALYLPASISFYHDAERYNRNFATHKLYQWPFETARLVSTMDPQLFINAVSLIKRYASGHSIYIISRYDDLLPVLAGKYSAMPYNELLTNVITVNDADNLAKQLKQIKPLYLFVDTDIERNFNSDIYNADDPFTKYLRLNDYSNDRAYVMDRIKNVYQRIKSDYRPVAKSELLTVYKHV